MANQYREMSKRHQEEINQFPIKFAFTEERFNEILREWNLTRKDLDKIVATGYGGYMLKSDVASYKEIIKRHRNELSEAVKNDETGKGFIYDMFLYELANHEYGYTCDYEDTLNALGYTIDEINADKALKTGFEMACQKLLQY